ncbi:Conserved hypothetical integral membrane protein YrbE1A [Rhodococcus sp. B7740]|uniref:MlaE family ABC transporter permease n=1 Tax=Rhodococcus sp. B7740 TaxID=1564114 RepID=UPI0005D985BD|nr:Conserved hypothetical integral membrane protein YrbE1A [Rhodococcus sp. B7740]
MVGQKTVARSISAEAAQMVRFSIAVSIALWSSVRRRRVHWQECVRQMWFLANVTTVSAALVMIPLGVAVALQVGSLAGRIGAGSYSGAVVAFLIIGQAAPLVCALIIAGVGGSAICADLGARTIREEIDALEVLGIDVLERLVVPRIIAAVIVTVLLNSIVMVVGIGACLLVHVYVQQGNAESFLRNLVTFSQSSDLAVAALKAASFAVISAVVASYKGLLTERGAQGVGNAVNEAVVMSFVLVFLANLALSQFAATVLPDRGTY